LRVVTTAAILERGSYGVTRLRPTLEPYALVAKLS
jgi:hypothetical protein